MRRLFRFLSLSIAGIIAVFAMSCREQNLWDPIPGTERNLPPAPPKVSVAFSKVQDPRIAKGEVNFWIFCANDTLPTITYQKGLMVRKSSDLVNIAVVGYVLNDVIYGWAKAKLLELDPAIDTTTIRMRLPSIKYDGTQWRLYYTVTGNTQASVIGYATSPTLEAQVWTDKGLVLSSKPGDDMKAAGPSFIALPGNTKHYLAYGDKFNGIYLAELDKVTGLPLSAPGTRIAYYVDDLSAQRIGFPELVYNSKYNAYYCFITSDDEHGYTQNVECIRSDNVTGPYLSFNGMDFTAGRANTDFNSSRILSAYQMYNGARVLNTAWAETGSMGVVQDGDNWYAVNNAKAVLSNSSTAIITQGSFVLQVRNLEWIADKGGWGCVQPMLYVKSLGDEDNTPITQDITNDNIVGVYDYCTRWYERGLKIFNAPGAEVIKFAADGTIDIGNNATNDGTWSFDASTRRMLMHSSIWSTPDGEDVFIVLRRTLDTDYSTSAPYPVIIEGAGYNNKFGQMPVIWMKQRPVIE